MAELITDEVKFQALYFKYNLISEKLNLKLTLEPETVKTWKQSGYFKHIRTQISRIPGIYVTCKKRVTLTKKVMHDFFFICETEELSAKLFDMINSYMGGKIVKNFSESDPHADITIIDQCGEFSKGCINTTCRIL